MLGCELVHFAEASFSAIWIVEWLALRASCSASDFAAIVGDLEHLLLLEVFLLLNVVAAHALANLHDCDDDPGDQEDHAQGRDQDRDQARDGWLFFLILRVIGVLIGDLSLRVR